MKTKQKDSLPKPDWLRIKLETGGNYAELKDMMRSKTLHTVCEEARCPTFMNAGRIVPPRL